jgi:hypothetical protein
MTLASNNTPIHPPTADESGASDFPLANPNSGANPGIRRVDPLAEVGARGAERAISAHDGISDDAETPMELDE